MVLCFLLVSGTLFSQESQRAKELLDQVQNKVNGYDNIYLDFKFVLDNKQEDIHQETRGNLTLKGEQYILNYLGATRMFDGEKICTIVPENQEVTIESAGQEEESSISPSKMLTFYQKGFYYKWDIEQTVKGRKIQYIELKPIKADSDIKKILLGIDVQTKNIYNLIQVGKNGTQTTITVTNFKTNQPLSKNTFTFDTNKYKKQGYYISEF